MKRQLQIGDAVIVVAADDQMGRGYRNGSRGTIVGRLKDDSDSDLDAFRIALHSHHGHGHGSDSVLVFPEEIAHDTRARARNVPSLAAVTAFVSTFSLFVTTYAICAFGGSTFA